MVGYSGEVKLIDFGTARGENRRCHTVAGVVFAKPGYVAPEVARQQVGDGRIDVYALGAMLWEMCAGKRLLPDDAQKHLEDVAAGRFKLPRLAPSIGVPEELDAILQSLCANDPDARYPSAAEAAVDLGRVLALAPPGPNGARSVRSRIATLMKMLWPHEPSRSRAEFAGLLKNARSLRVENGTPPSSGVIAAYASQMNAPDGTLAGTPYRLLRKIGEGASGEVFEAEHVELGRRYAIKVLAAAHAAAHAAVDRFRREARAVANLSHPNLVQLHDFGKSTDGRVFLVMELLSGKTLDALVQQGIDWQRGTELAIQAARALEAAHGAGVVHRDLKPQNLFLTKDETLKLLDFGVAMALADTSGEPKPQQGFAVFGTPEYMAPEQVAGEAVDARCDVYALGCVLYELVTGTRVFEGSPVVVMGKQLRELPQPPRVRAPRAQISKDIERVILKALSKDKDNRYASATEMREALETALAAPGRRTRRARIGVSAAIALSAVVAVSNHHRVRGALGSLFRPSPTLASHAPHEDTRDPSAPHAGASESQGASGHLEQPASPQATARLESTGPSNSAPGVESPAPSGDKMQIATDSLASSIIPTPASARAAQLPRLTTAGATTQTARKPSTAIATPSGAARSTANEDRAPSPSRVAVAGTPAPSPPALNARDLKSKVYSALKSGDLIAAKRAAEMWLAVEKTIEPRLVLASVLDRTGKKADARALLSEYLQLHPDAADVKELLAKLDQPAGHRALEPTAARTTRPGAP